LVQVNTWRTPACAHAPAAAHVLHARAAVRRVVLGALLAVHRDGHTHRGGASGADQVGRLTLGRTVGNHVIDDQHPALDRGADQRAAFAVVFRFLAVVGIGHAAALAGQADGHGGGQRDALVGRAEEHVEFEARGEQAACIEFAQPHQLLTVVEQAGVEEVRRLPPRLGLEIAKAQHPSLHRELDEVLRQRVGGGEIRHRGQHPWVFG
jgi:hypothetical protein